MCPVIYALPRFCSPLPVLPPLSPRFIERDQLPAYLGGSVSLDVVPGSTDDDSSVFDDECKYAIHPAGKVPLTIPDWIPPQEIILDDCPSKGSGQVGI